jgi:adenosine kinase
MPSFTYDLLGFGAAIVDVLARADDDLLVREKLAKGTMALIDETRAFALQAMLVDPKQASGGSAANTCAGVASLGGSAAFVGKVKDDALGRVFAEDLRTTGVGYGVPPAADGPATAACYILVTPDGERTMNTYLGASGTLAPADLDPELPRTSRVLFAEGYLWDSPTATETFESAARIAQGGGGKVSFTLSDPFCVDRHRGHFRTLVASGRVDLLFANESEAKSLYETADLETALDAMAREARLAVVTLGENGAVVLAGDSRIRIEAFPVDRVVDATGAGDLFAAGFLFGFARGAGHEQSARLGALAAAEIISHMGARPEQSLAALAKANGLSL